MYLSLNLSKELYLKCDKSVAMAIGVLSDHVQNHHENESTTVHRKFKPTLGILIMPEFSLRDFKGPDIEKSPS